MTAYYFGCKNNQMGHYLFDSNRGSLIRQDAKHLPLSLQVPNIDSPPKGNISSKVFLEYVENYTVISMVDNSVDKRPGSHAKFFIEGSYSLEKMLKLFEQNFPREFNRIKNFRNFSS